MILINPALREETQPAIIKSLTYTTFPMGLGYLAAYLREYNKVNAEIVDESINPLTSNILKNKVSNWYGGPKIIGISCLTGTMSRALELTHLIKKIDPEIRVVMGGIHASALPEDTLKKSAADIVVRGEAEHILSDLYTTIKEKGDLREVQGISFKLDNEIIHNAERPFIKNIAEIPPFPYDLFGEHIELYKDFGTIISSRGCPFHCTFCSQRVISGYTKYRFLPNDRIIEKIRLLVDKYQQKKIWFIEDSFTINKKRMISLLDDIIASGYHKKAAFITQSRGKGLTWDMLLKLKEANFVSINFGFETGSERVMSTIKKGETVEDNIEAVKLTHKAGLLTDGSFIMGLPTETKEERKMSSKIARSIPLDGARFNIAIPYPGTELNEIAAKEKRLLTLNDWSNYSNQNYLISDSIPYAPIGTKRIELVYDTLVANLAFNLRPKTLIKTFFTSPLSVGAVLSLPKKWFLSPKTLFIFLRFSILLVNRFAVIAIKNFLAKFDKTGDQGNDTRISSR